MSHNPTGDVAVTQQHVSKQLKKNKSNITKRRNAILITKQPKSAKVAKGKKGQSELKKSKSIKTPKVAKLGAETIDEVADSIVTCPSSYSVQFD